MVSLPAGVLANMRTAAGSLLPDTCTIQTRTNTVSALGEATPTWASTYTSVACRLDPVSTVSMYESMQASRIVSDSDYTLTVPYTQAIDATMRVLVDGTAYEVLGVDTGKSWAVTRRASLRRAV